MVNANPRDGFIDVLRTHENTRAKGMCPRIWMQECSRMCLGSVLTTALVLMMLLATSTVCAGDTRAASSCNAGYVGNASTGSCTGCVSGKYKPATGNGGCTACGTGKYGNATGQTAESSCMACGQGKYRLSSGIVTVTCFGGCSCPTSPSVSPVTISDGPSDS
jgi:hypothetical protein